MWQTEVQTLAEALLVGLDTLRTLFVKAVVAEVVLWVAMGRLVEPVCTLVLVLGQ